MGATAAAAAAAAAADIYVAAHLSRGAVAAVGTAKVRTYRRAPREQVTYTKAVQIGVVGAAIKFGTLILEMAFSVFIPTYCPNFLVTYIASNLTIIPTRLNKNIVDEIFRWASSSEVTFQI